MVVVAAVLVVGEEERRRRPVGAVHERAHGVMCEFLADLHVRGRVLVRLGVLVAEPVRFDEGHLRKRAVCRVGVVLRDREHVTRRVVPHVREQQLHLDRREIDLPAHRWLGLAERLEDRLLVIDGDVVADVPE